MSDLDTFAEWVKKRRGELKLTQDKLAEETGLGRTYINSIERGRIKLPQYETRQKLHRVFGSDDRELQDYGIIQWDDYGNEWVPVDQGKKATASPTEVTGLTDVEIPGLAQITGGPYGILGAALVYAFRAMTGDQRKALLKLLTEIDDSLTVSDMQDVPF